MLQWGEASRAGVNRFHSSKIGRKFNVKPSTDSLDSVRASLD